MLRDAEYHGERVASTVSLARLWKIGRNVELVLRYAVVAAGHRLRPPL